MKYLLIFVFGVCVLTSCSNEEGVPDYVIKKEKFVEILTEFQTAEALVRLGYHRSSDSLIPNDSIYAAVFRKLEISKADFDSNYNYYSNRPKEFEKIYEEVITNLSTRSAELIKESKDLPENEAE